MLFGRYDQDMKSVVITAIAESSKETQIILSK